MIKSILMTIGDSRLALVVSLVALFILGMLRYGPIFGKRWMKEVGIKKKDVQMKPWMFIASILGNVLLVSFMILMISMTDGSLHTGLVLGAMITIGAVVPLLGGHSIWDKTTLPLYLINLAYSTVSIFLITILVVVL